MTPGAQPVVHASPAFDAGEPVFLDGVKEVAEPEDYPYEQQPYKFGYDIQDEQGNTQYRKEESDADNRREGSYGFHDSNGLYREVTYVADKNGFRAWIKTNEPGTSNKSPAGVVIVAETPPAHVVQAQKGLVGPGQQVRRVPHGATATPGDLHPNIVKAEHQDRGAPAPAVAAIPAFGYPESGAILKFTSADAMEGPLYRTRTVKRVPSQPTLRVPEVPPNQRAFLPAAPQLRYQPYIPGHHSNGHHDNQIHPVVTHVSDAVPVYTSVRQFPMLNLEPQDNYPDRDEGEIRAPKGVTYVKPPPESYQRAAAS